MRSYRILTLLLAIALVSFGVTAYGMGMGGHFGSFFGGHGMGNVWGYNGHSGWFGGMGMGPQYGVSGYQPYYHGYYRGGGHMWNGRGYNGMYWGNNHSYGW